MNRYQIMSLQLDDSGNAGYVVEQEIESDEDSILNELVLLNTTHEHEHVAQEMNSYGCRMIYAPIPFLSEVE